MAQYTANARGISNYLKHDRDLKKELHRRMILGMGVAVGLAPRGPTGRLAASAEIVDDGPNGGINHDRMQLSLHFMVHYAVPVTYPKRQPDARDYLRAAIPAMERGR